MTRIIDKYYLNGELYKIKFPQQQPQQQTLVDIDFTTCSDTDIINAGFLNLNEEFGLELDPSFGLKEYTQFSDSPASLQLPFNIDLTQHDLYIEAEVYQEEGDMRGAPNVFILGTPYQEGLTKYDNRPQWRVVGLPGEIVTYRSNEYTGTASGTFNVGDGTTIFGTPNAELYRAEYQDNPTLYFPKTGYPRTRKITAQWNHSTKKITTSWECLTEGVSLSDTFERDLSTAGNTFDTFLAGNKWLDIALTRGYPDMVNRFRKLKVTTN